MAMVNEQFRQELARRRQKRTAQPYNEGGDPGPNPPEDPYPVTEGTPPPPQEVPPPVDPSQGQMKTDQVETSVGIGKAASPGGWANRALAGQSDRDVVKNSYRDIIEKGSNVDAGDPVIRRQADAYAAQQERTRRNAIADAAEGYGPYQTGALQGEARMATERAGQASGAFEAQLIGREIESRRQQVMDALNGLYGTVSDEDRNSLQIQLAQLNADLERARMEQQQKQFEDQLGFNLADREAYWNWQASQGGYQ